MPLHMDKHDHAHSGHTLLSLVLKKNNCFLPLYILQPLLQHVTRDRNDFWKHNTIYLCLSKENYKNAN